MNVHSEEAAELHVFWQWVGGVIMDDCYKTGLCLMWTQCSGYNSSATVTSTTIVWRLAIKSQSSPFSSCLQAPCRIYTWLFTGTNPMERYLSLLFACVCVFKRWGTIVGGSVFVQGSFRITVTIQWWGFCLLGELWLLADYVQLSCSSCFFQLFTQMWTSGVICYTNTVLFV